MIILLRHGESTDVADGLVSGQRDVPLTETGRFQAAKAAWAIVRYGITRIVSSDLVRAEETAKIIARELGLPPPQRDPRFRERNWGECQGQPKGNKSPLAADEAPQGGESYDEFYARVIAAFSGISAATLIVTHAGPIRCILSDCSLPPDTLTPCQFVCVPCRSKKEARRPDSPDKNIYHLYGGTISPGELSGKAVYVSGFEDVPKCTADSLLLLGNCSKDAAVEAMRCNAPAVNLTGALTAHLTCGRVTFAPFAVARSWPDGLPPEGEEITIEIINNEVNETLPPLPDITLRGSADVQRVGGKGAGLVMLEELGFRVPDFLLVDTEQAAAWMKSESPLEDAVLWCRKRLKNPRTRWAVRSNANVEDGGNDAMSGSFESLLDLVPEQVPGAILRIIQSCDNAEIRQRLQSGALTEIPKMAIVIQKMVENILFSGTVFSPAPDNPCVIHLEAVLETTGDTLMDGTRRADISARFDAFANLLDLTMADQSLYQKIEPLVKQTAREALAIYHSTGRGDVEFSVDRDGRCWWLQARPLNTMFVMVDRCNFHALPKKYYQEIAFRVMEANRMPSVYFRLISPPGGMFGYSVGILRRDILFRLMLQKDPCHLEAVTQFGWQVTRDIEKMISAPEQYSLDELFNKLVLHGAVQAPFSIPMSASRKERHQSWTVGETNVSGYLEEKLDGLVHKINAKYSGGDILNHLRQPEKTASVLQGKIALLELIRSADPSDQQILDCIIPDLRDIPDLSPPGMKSLREAWLARAEAIRQSPNGVSGLEAEINQQRLGMEKNNLWRLDFLDVVKRAAPEEYEECKLWVDYLLMKAEANEIHSMCRGKAFIYFARQTCGETTD